MGWFDSRSAFKIQSLNFLSGETVHHHRSYSNLTFEEENGKSNP